MTHPESTHPYSSFDQFGDEERYIIAVETRDGDDDQPINVYLPWKVVYSKELKMELYNGPVNFASYSLEEFRDRLRRLLAATYAEVLVREEDSQKSFLPLGR